MYLLRMPKADENMAEGTVVRWLVAEGDPVAREQDVCECVADKGEFMVWAEEGGTLLRVFAPEQSAVPVGYVLACIGAPGEQPHDRVRDIETENAALVGRARETLTVTAPADGRSSAPDAETTSRVRATPAARRVAKELGVSLAEVSAALGGQLAREGDVRAFAEDQAGKGNA